MSEGEWLWMMGKWEEGCGVGRGPRELTILMVVVVGETNMTCSASVAG